MAALPRASNCVIDFGRAASDFGLGLGASPLETRALDDVRAAAACFSGGPAGDVFATLRDAFGFQGDSASNAREAVVLLLASRLSRTEHDASVMSEAHVAAIGDLRDDVLWNYRRWCAHVGARPLSVARAFSARSSLLASPVARTDGAAYEIGLVHLIWGEAANLRFCPEFLAAVFHDLGNALARSLADGGAPPPPPPVRFLEAVVAPAFAFLERRAGAPGDHRARLNYDDFNESCHALRTSRSTSRSVFAANGVVADRKTYYETRSYFHVVRSYFRVVALHVVTLHAMIVLAFDQCGGGYGRADLCWAEPCLSLAGLAFLREVAEVLALGSADGNLARAVRLGIVSAALYALIRLRIGDIDGFVSVARALLGGYGGFECFRFLLPRPHAMLRRALARYAPFVQDCLGGGAWNSFFCAVDPRTRERPWGDRLGALAAWVLALAAKGAVNYVYLVHPLADLTVRLRRKDALSAAEERVVFRGHLFGVEWADENHLLLAVPAWCMLAPFYFIDLEMWYVLFASLAAALVGLRRGVGAFSNPAAVLPAIAALPGIVGCGDLGAAGGAGSPLHRGEGRHPARASEGTPHRELWFAAVWNAVVRSMRREDLVSDAEAAALSYAVEPRRGPVAAGDLVPPPACAEAAPTFSRIANPEVWRRLRFFASSFSGPAALPPVGASVAASTLVPYYNEPVRYALSDLLAPTNDGVSVLELLRTVDPDDFENLLERCAAAGVDRRSIDAVLVEEEDDLALLEEAALVDGAGAFRAELERWASFRGQTLLRTARGFSYADDAYRLRCGLALALGDGGDVDAASAAALLADGGGGGAAEFSRLKYTLVLACQVYGKMRAAGAAEADRIDDLLREFPNLRVAFVDEARGAFASVLVKYDFAEDRVAEVYRVALPGNFMLGEAKPNNQNHALIFARGEAVQACDMNQDNYLEEAVKLPAFLAGAFGDHRVSEAGPRIAGHREHVFTQDVSALAAFMSHQETTFVTATQRALDRPFGVRFHYGHPDFFDKVGATTCGGMAKASKGINLSEDIFGGFNVKLRGGESSQSDLLQCGKGRDVGFAQISTFVAKISMGNGEQTLSRDVWRCVESHHWFWGTPPTILGPFVLAPGVLDDERESFQKFVPEHSS